MKVYAFNYCPCIHESGWVTISLHKTRKGAEMAMEFHREVERKEHQEYLKRLDKEARKYAVEFGRSEKWEVEEVEILD